jgi:hypothetical protein
VHSVDRDETCLDILDIEVEKRKTALVANLDAASALRKSMQGNKIDPVESIKAMEQLEVRVPNKDAVEWPADKHSLDYITRL